MTKVTKSRQHPLYCDRCKKIGFSDKDFYKDDGRLYCERCVEDIQYATIPGVECLS